MVKKELPEFDVLLEMARKRPEQLESLRLELVEDIISSASEDVQRRLRGLQFKVDVTRRTARTPMASCIKISQMMFDSLERLREALNNPDLSALPKPMQQADRYQELSQTSAGKTPEPNAVNTGDGYPEPVANRISSRAPDNVVSIFTYRARRSQTAKEARF